MRGWREVLTTDSGTVVQYSEEVQQWSVNTSLFWSTSLELTTDNSDSLRQQQNNIFITFHWNTFQWSETTEKAPSDQVKKILKFI